MVVVVSNALVVLRAGTLVRATQVKNIPAAVVTAAIL